MGNKWKRMNFKAVIPTNTWELWWKGGQNLKAVWINFIFRLLKKGFILG